jgi:hypothetical protein
MSTEYDSVNLWRELEIELGARSDGRYTLTSVRAADAGWLRRAEPSPEIDEALMTTMERHGSYFHHVLVQGKRCTTSADLLRTLGDALEFPGYYGVNWGALHECLYELLIVSDGRLGSYYGERLGRRARALVIRVADAERVLEKESRHDFDTFLDLLRFIASRPSDPLGRELPRGQLFVLFSVNPTSPPGANYHLTP